MKRFLFLAVIGSLLAAASPPFPRSHAQNPPNRPRVALPPPSAAKAPTVTWSSTTRFFAPESTIELRFPSPMVESWGDSLPVEAIPATRVPLTISPALAGTWVWRSAESGAFVPSDEPQRGQTYTFSVREGQRDLSGRPLAPAQPSLTLKAAGLRLVARHPTWFSTHNAPRTPQLLLQFNDRVNAGAAADGIRFVEKSGQSTRATVRLATMGDLPRRYEVSPGFLQQALSLAGASDVTRTASPTLPLPGTLVVSTTEPLPIGEEWRLVVSDVPSADGRTRLEEPASIAIGNVVPLQIDYSSAANDIGAPKTISFRFNLPIAPEMTAADIVRHVSLAPEPPGMKVAFEKEWVRIAGDFAHETKYQLTVTPGLLSADGRPMRATHQETFEFKVLQPTVALPAFSANQLATGRGLFDVHTVNLKGIRVRIKAADRESLIYALRAYRHYEDPDRGEEENWDNRQDRTGFARIPFDAMPGQKIFEKQFQSEAPIDDQDEFVVDWRQALNSRKFGALFITVEGEARDQWQGQTRRFGAQAFVQLTDIGLAWKLAGEEAFLFAFSQSTGRPMSGVTLTAFDTEKNQVGRAVTAEDGTARLSRKNATWVLAERADDLHAVEIDGPGAEGLGMWRFGVPYDWEPASGPRRQVSLFTERPIYQPGHTVYFKAVSRLVDTEGVRLPPATEPAVLRAYDAKGRLFHQRDVQFSRSGSLDGALELPPGTLGHYRLQIALPALSGGADGDGNDAVDEEGEVNEEGESEEDAEGGRPGRGGNTFTTSFLVEEYKTNTFQIAFDQESFKLDGEKASIALQASYLLGKPLAKAKLAWTAGISRHWFESAAFPDFAFLDSRSTYYWDEEGYHNVPEALHDAGDDEALMTDQARTDLGDDGRATLDFTIPLPTGAPRPRDLTLTAEVTDVNQQTITERWKKTFHPSAFYLGINRRDVLTGAGQPVDIALAAARTDGQPWTEPVEARVTVEKINFINVRVQTVGGGSNVKTDAQRDVVAEGTLTVQPKGTDSKPFTWTPRTPGFYYITARATDADGRPVESVTSFQVFGEGWATWQDRDGVQIDLSADKTAYSEGETAKILVKSPVLGRALVTLERRSVLRHFLVDITSNAQAVEIPIEASMTPNVFVSVFVVRGSEASPRQHKSPDYKVGFVDLRVMDARSRLAVAVAPGQPAYRPGDQGMASAVVTDGRGQPVAGAEVTFWAADDGVLTLRPYSPPNLWDIFHRPQALAVTTGTSLMRLLAEDPQELAFTNKGYMIGGGDVGSDAAGERLRRNFQAVAFFRGAVTTDAQGRVSLPFTVPDNLTRFRLIAVATAGADAFGTGQGTFEINKPLMLEPALPRFANVGDEVTAKGIVLNHTDQAFEVEVSLALDGHASTTEPLVKRVSLAPHGVQAVSFPLVFNEAGTAVWQWKAASVTTGVTLADSVQSTLSVGYAQPILREMLFTTLGADRSQENLLATASPELLTGRGQITVTVSNSSILEAGGAFAHLLRYPYGCVEQTTSSTLPWIAMHNLGDAAPWTNKSPEDISRAIQKGTDRLLSMQTSGGGLSYWPGADRPELWASTYGGMGLALARDAGARIPTDRLDQLAAFLSAALRNTGNESDAGKLFDRAFACYTLALLGKPEPAYHEVLASKLSQLSHPARALLALATLSSGGSKEDARKILDAPIDPLLEQWSGNLFNSRLTAMNLLVWLRIDPTHRVTASLTDRLLKERTSRGDWGCTYDNAWALLALAADAQSAGMELEETNLKIAFADQSATLTLPARAATRSVTLPFNEQESARRLTVTGQGRGRIRVATEIVARPLNVPLQPRIEGLGIRRTYEKVAPNGSTSPAENLEVGDLVAVTLDLNIPTTYRYLAVDDPLPSILEAINPKFTSQSQTAAVPSRDPDETRLSWWSDHEELRTDRALFFANELWQRGNYRLSYLARVVAEGVVTAPPAKIEAMYEPERYGLSGTQRLSAKAGTGKVAGQSR
jgi:uncharacterized protein YfaS (alpha-2-macroglobulin family)